MPHDECSNRGEKLQRRIQRDGEKERRRGGKRDEEESRKSLVSFAALSLSRSVPRAYACTGQGGIAAVCVAAERARGGHH